jgi:hypothetical protein
MRILVILIGLLLMVIGGFCAFDSMMAGNIETIWQQIAQQIRFYGGGCIFALGLIALVLGSLECAQVETNQLLRERLPEKPAEPKPTEEKQ